MSHLIVYDISDPKRLRRVARACEDFGVRLQNSVFECELTAPELRRLQKRILQNIDLESDSVRYLPVCTRDRAARMAYYPPDQPIPNAVPPSHWIV